MTRINPVQRTAAIRLLTQLLQNPDEVDPVGQIATSFSLQRSTVATWKRKIQRGVDPEADLRSAKRREALSQELLALVAHHAQIKRAHASAVAGGRYESSYDTFRRQFFEHDQPTRRGVLFGRKELIKTQPVMRYPTVRRGEVTVMDHTRSDVRCLHPRSKTAVRPWVSILADKGTGVVLGVHLRWDPPDAEWVAAILAASMQTRLVPLTDSPDDLVTLGGRPGAVLVDNGPENTGNLVVELVARLGVALATTTPGHPWQNGLAENFNRQYQQAVEHPAPGYVRAGQDVNGDSRYVTALPADQPLDDLLIRQELQGRADQWADDVNRTKGKDGLTPLQRWHQSGEIREVTDAELRVASLRGAKRAYAYTKNGLRFQGRDYQGPGLTDYIGKGSVLGVRYMPNSPQFVDVYDGDRFLVRAEDVDRLSASMQSLLIAQRRRATGRVAEAEQESLLKRRRDADEARLGAGELPELADFPEQRSPEELGYRSHGRRAKQSISRVEEKQIRDRNRHVDRLIADLNLDGPLAEPDDADPEGATS